jgi:hypothetical protein
MSQRYEERKETLYRWAFVSSQEMVMAQERRFELVVSFVRPQRAANTTGMFFPLPVKILDELFLRLSTHAVLYLTIPKALQVRWLTDPHVICRIYALRSHASVSITARHRQFVESLVYLY